MRMLGGADYAALVMVRHERARRLMAKLSVLRRVGRETGVGGAEAARLLAYSRWSNLRAAKRYVTRADVDAALAGGLVTTAVQAAL